MVHRPLVPSRSPAPRCGVGANPAGPFEVQVTEWLEQEGVRWRVLLTDAAHSGHLIVLHNPRTCTAVALHLLQTPRKVSEVLPPSTTAKLSQLFAARPRKRRLIHLWEDQWSNSPQIVRSRLLAALGRTRREFARRTIVRRIDTATLDAFLLDNHLWGPTKARYRYGLYTAPRRHTLRAKPDGKCTGGIHGSSTLVIKKKEAAGHDEGELIAVASFSARRHMARADGRRSRSHELIRYCSKRDLTVVGGISKLIAAFAAEAEPDDIVTVVDRDWSTSEGWVGLGFVSVQQMKPVTFFIGPDGLRCHLGTGPNQFRRRLPPELLEEFEDGWSTVSGSDSNTVIFCATCPGDCEEKHRELSKFLADHGYFPVFDAGAERLILLLQPHAVL